MTDSAKTHRLVEDDTLSGLAAHYGTTTTAILLANPKLARSRTLAGAPCFHEDVMVEGRVIALPATLGTTFLPGTAGGSCPTGKTFNKSAKMCGDDTNPLNLSAPHCSNGGTWNQALGTCEGSTFSPKPFVPPGQQPKPAPIVQNPQPIVIIQNPPQLPQPSGNATLPPQTPPATGLTTTEAVVGGVVILSVVGAIAYFTLHQPKLQSSPGERIPMTMSHSRRHSSGFGMNSFLREAMATVDSLPPSPSGNLGAPMTKANAPKIWSCRPLRVTAKTSLRVATNVGGKTMMVNVVAGQALPKGSWYEQQGSAGWMVYLGADAYLASGTVVPGGTGKPLSGSLADRCFDVSCSAIASGGALRGGVKEDPTQVDRLGAPQASRKPQPKKVTAAGMYAAIPAAPGTTTLKASGSPWSAQRGTLPGPGFPVLTGEYYFKVSRNNSPWILGMLKDETSIAGTSEVHLWVQDSNTKILVDQGPVDYGDNSIITAGSNQPGVTITPGAPTRSNGRLFGNIGLVLPTTTSMLPTASSPNPATWACRPVRMTTTKNIQVVTMVNGSPMYMVVQAGKALPSGAWYEQKTANGWVVYLTGKPYGADEPAPFFVSQPKAILLGQGDVAKGVLVISCQAQTSSGGALRGAPSSVGAPMFAGKRATYIVKKGVAFDAIARRFQIPMAALVHANPHLPRTTWNGVQILDLTEGDQVVIPAVTIPTGWYWDSGQIAYRARPACPVGQIYDLQRKTCVWPTHANALRVLGAAGTLGGNEECSSTFLPDSYYDGNACTASSGQQGACSGGSCVEPIKTGLSDNSDGKPCNVSGTSGIWQGGVCVAGIQSGTCKDVFGNAGKYNSSNICVTLTGNPGDGCVGDGGIQGTFDQNGNCVVCSQYQEQDANGQCVDAPCPPCMDRPSPGDDCYAITSAAQCGADAPIYDPNGDGQGHCCFGDCTGGSVYNYTTHTCDCPAGTGWDGTSCSAGKTPVSPPPPPAPPAPCPTGQTKYSQGANAGQCTPVVPVPPVVPATPMPLWEKLAIGAAALAVVGGGVAVAVKESKKKKAKKAAKHAA